MVKVELAEYSKASDIVKVNSQLTFRLLASSLQFYAKTFHLLGLRFFSLNLAYAAVESVGKAFLLPIDCVVGWLLFRERKQGALQTRLLLEG